jgi:hypothetical protein
MLNVLPLSFGGLTQYLILQKHHLSVKVRDGMEALQELAGSLVRTMRVSAPGGTEEK